MVDFNKLTLFQGITQKMDYLSERQNIIAQNIANANTPGYKARDLKKVDFANVLANHEGRLDVAITHKNHIQPPMNQSDFKVMKKGKKFETTISGNSVVLDEEMQKLAQTSGSYQETLALYRKMTQLIKIASGQQNA